ncbi:dipeptide ABC transporter ATP-binding protein [Georgenia alba]|uniref:Dipeptide ABC transporter ATP-binding protein n=1 Tax=Georgenia alba TaxID=2233858 RepID=A0ABW2Q2V6_9MICO
MADSPLLEIRDLEVSYGATPVVHGVSLTVRPGERVAIVGESGSGKTTTAAAVLRLLPGAGRITGGSVALRGTDLAAATETGMRAVRGKQIGYVPQDPMSNLNPVMRVGEQVRDALTAHGIVPADQARARAVELLTEAGIPDAGRRARQYPHEFSGGMRQRVLIAMALACRPALLVADEPTSALDVTVQRQILDHLETLIATHDTSLLLITHDLGLAADRADRVVVMSGGRIVEQGAPDRILRRPEEDYTRRLLAAAPSLSAVRERGREGSATGRPGRDREPVLEAVNVTKDFRLRGSGTLRAVDDVTFTVRPGTTTAVVGESGSGKTTLARMVLGLDRPTSGQVTVAGHRVDELRGRRSRAVRRQMQPVFQDPYGSLDPTHSVERLIDEPLRVFGIGDRQSRRRRVAELLDQVSLPRSLAQRRPAELSGGQRQRVAIARALAPEPAVVVLDEAVSALDVLVQAQILDLLAELQDELELTYLFITHDLAVVHEIADDILVMRSGSVVERGGVASIFDEPREEYTRQLLAAIPGAQFFA